jgi:hypothetical protein
MNFLPVDSGTCSVAATALASAPASALERVHDRQGNQEQAQADGQADRGVPGPGELDLARIKKVKASDERATTHTLRTRYARDRLGA